MANGQQIIWKYETPLEGKYLATFGYGALKPGLVAPIRARFSANTLYISPFQVFLEPTNPTAEGLMVKVFQTVEVSIEITNPNSLAVGITYEWTRDSSVEAQFEVLTSYEAARDYTGIILCMFDYATKTIRTQAADFTSVYWLQQGRTGVFLRPTLPRDKGYEPTSFQVSRFTGIADDYTITVQYAVGADTLISARKPTLQIDLKGCDTGKFYLIGYQRQYIIVDSVPKNPPLKVLQVADKIEALSTTIQSSILAIIYWTGASDTSTVYQMLGGGTGSKQAVSAFSQQASDITITEDGHFRFFISPERLIQQYRESLSQGWDSSEEVVRASKNLLGLRYHTSPYEMFVGVGSREYADLYKAAIGKAIKLDEDDVLYWWHCNKLKGTNPVERLGREDFHLLQEASIVKQGQEFDTKEGEVTIISPILENNHYWEKDIKMVLSKERSTTPLKKMFAAGVASLFLDFWMVALEANPIPFRLLTDEPKDYIELGSTRFSNVLYHNIKLIDASIKIEPDSFVWVEDGKVYELLSPAITIYLYAPDGITSQRIIYFKNSSDKPVRVNLTQTQFKDIKPTAFVSIIYVPTSDPEEHKIDIVGIVSYTEPSTTVQEIVDLATGKKWKIRDVHNGALVPYTGLPSEAYGLFNVQGGAANNQVELEQFKIGKWYHVSLRAIGTKKDDGLKLSSIYLYFNGVKHVLPSKLVITGLELNRLKTSIIWKELAVGSIKDIDTIGVTELKLPWADIAERLPATQAGLSLISNGYLRTDIFDTNEFKGAVDYIIQNTQSGKALQEFLKEIIKNTTPDAALLETAKTVAKQQAETTAQQVSTATATTVASETANNKVQEVLPAMLDNYGNSAGFTQSVSKVTKGMVPNIVTGMLDDVEFIAKLKLKLQ